MAIVAIVAIIFGGASMKLRSDRFRGLARQYAELEKASRDRADEIESMVFRQVEREISSAKTFDDALIWSVANLDVHRDAARDRVASRYYSQLKRKYRRAARYPWLTVPPDPPEPE